MTLLILIKNDKQKVEFGDFSNWCISLAARQKSIKLLVQDYKSNQPDQHALVK